MATSGCFHSEAESAQIQSPIIQPVNKEKILKDEKDMQEPQKSLSLRIMSKEPFGLATLCSKDPSYSHYSTGPTSRISIRTVITVNNVTLSSPSPTLCCIEKAPKGTKISQIRVDESEHGHSSSSSELATSKALRDVHISARLMQDFLDLAIDNTEKDLETCGVLGAFFENETFYVTTLIIPKQESTSNSCQAINEEDVFSIQSQQSLYPVGWIHTHPSQSCFMSSVDLHTHYSYQVMVPEAFAIVLAPTDSSRTSGIFRLSNPTGMSTLRECQEKGFHPHNEPADGSPIYGHCSHVYRNSNLRFEIIDLR